METDPIAAFVSREDPLEITVNFGVLAGRELDRAEVDSLGEALLRMVGGFTLFTGRRYEFATGAAEVVAYEARLVFPSFVVDSREGAGRAAVDELLETVTLWARDSTHHPPAGEEDLASRLARETAP